MRLPRALAALPAGLWVCFALGAANAAVWAVVTPSFQVPDELAHAGYVQYLAETGRIPNPRDTTPGHFDLSEEETSAMQSVPFSYLKRPTWTAAQDAAARRLLARPLSRVHEQGAGAAATYPPLYYALEAIPYRIAAGGNFFDRLLAMRLLSALFAGATAAFTFLFLRELVPSTPWAWRVGALAVAFQPVAAFVAGGVNPDSLLWAASAALTWLIARGFRRGISLGLLAAIGAALAVALLTKAASFALVPPALFAIGTLVWRSPAAERTRAARAAVVAVGLAACAFGVWLASTSTSASAGLAPAPHTTLTGQLTYIWETFLPRLPGMHREFTFYPTYPLWQTYFQGLTGRFGYFQYNFSANVYLPMLGFALLLLGLAGRALALAREALRRRRAELACYLTLTGSLVLLIAIAGYHYRRAVGFNFEQTRYLFPLLPLYGALFALAARGAGRRLGPAVGALLVVAVVAHNAFAVLLTLQRYYL
ncbi:MAG: hypothetical protein NVSMB25_25450 [Thermoleophilaceae bacterium]